MPVKPKRTLYDCFNAKVHEDGRIRCAAGHCLNSVTDDGGISADRLAKGKTLDIKACYNCPDFDKMDGGEVKSYEKGWLK